MQRHRNRSNGTQLATHGAPPSGKRRTAYSLTVSGELLSSLAAGRIRHEGYGLAVNCPPFRGTRSTARGQAANGVQDTEYGERQTAKQRAVSGLRQAVFWRQPLSSIVPGRAHTHSWLPRWPGRGRLSRMAPHSA